MPETFMDRRRNMLRALIEGYGGDPSHADKYLEIWTKGRVRQLDIEMMVARDHGATSDELAEQFGYSNAAHALSALNSAKRKARVLGIEVD